jgi:hypothetical protein
MQACFSEVRVMIVFIAEFPHHLHNCGFYPLLSSSPAPPLLHPTTPGGFFATLGRAIQIDAHYVYFQDTLLS